MPSKRFSRNMRIILGAAVILILSQFVNGLLSVSSFEQTYRSSLISKFTIRAKELKRQIETGVNFGKPLYIFGNMDVIFRKISEQDPQIKNLYVTLPDGSVLYGTDGDSVKKPMPLKTVPRFVNNPTGDLQDHSEIVSAPGSYYIALPIYYNLKEWVGTVYLQFDRAIVSESVRALILDNLKVFSVILVIALVVLSLVLTLITADSDRYPGGKLKKKTKISLAILGVLLVSQLCYAWYNNGYFEAGFLRIFNTNMKALRASVRSEMEGVLSWNLAIDHLKKADAVLAQHLKNSPECSEILVTDTKGAVKYGVFRKQGDRIDTYSVLEPGFAGIPVTAVNIALSERQKVDPLNANHETVGYVVMRVNEDLIRTKLRGLMLDILTVIVVSLVFSMELIGFLALALEKEDLERTAAAPEKALRERLRMNEKIIRIVAFMFYFSVYIPLSFLPMFIESVFLKHPVHFFGFSKETMITLPISSYLLGISLFMILTAWVSKRLSLKKMFFLSCALFITGSALSLVSSNLIMLILARFVSGMGYGGALVSNMELAIRLSSKDNRGASFGNQSAGFAAAIICGIPIGGVVVSRLGFEAGILLSILFTLLFLVFLYFNYRDKDVSDGRSEEPDQPPVERSEQSLGASFLVLFKNRSIFASLFFTSVPFQLIYIGIYQYITPLYMSSIGSSSADIGRVLTIFGVISLMTPLISRIADRTKNDRIFMIIGNLLMGGALLFFALSSEIYIFIIVMFFLGFGRMMVDAVEETYVTSSPEAALIGESKMLSLYETYGKLIAILMPLVTGFLITGVGYSKSVIVIGIYTLASVVLFALLSRNMRTPVRVQPEKEPADVFQ